MQVSPKGLARDKEAEKEDPDLCELWYHSLSPGQECHSQSQLEIIFVTAAV